MSRLLRFALLLAIVLIPAVASAQQGNTTTILFVGAPSGSCAYPLYGIDGSNGDLYDCPSGTWVKVGSATGGGITALTGDVSASGSGSVAATVNGLLGHALPSIATGYLNWTGSAWALSSITAGANTALSNLASVSINTSLLAQTGVDLGSTANQFRNIFIFGAGTYGTTYEEITGTPTGTRVWTLQDATDTLVGRATTDTFTNKSIALTEVNSGLTSGGIVCATSTTVIAMTAALGAGVIPKGGGAGVCPSASALTDNGTSFVTTETLTLPVGSQASTALNFGGANTGLYSASGEVRVSVGNRTVVQWQSGGQNLILLYGSITNCKANGTAANPSVASCTAAPAGMFSCATAASAGTCQVNTTAVTANSEILITQNAADGGASQLNVTCNTTSVLPAAAPILLSKNTGTSFTISLGTVTANPACFEYLIIN